MDIFVRRHPYLFTNREMAIIHAWQQSAYLVPCWRCVQQTIDQSASSLVDDRMMMLHDASIIWYTKTIIDMNTRKDSEAALSSRSTQLGYQSSHTHVAAYRKWLNTNNMKAFCKIIHEHRLRRLYEYQFNSQTINRPCT